MSTIAALLPQDLYHAYVIEGNIEELSAELKDCLEKRKEIVSQSPDLLIQLYSALSISDIPLIKEWHSGAHISGGKKVCILGAKFINHEAQQALLKLLEEPAERTHFFVIVPDASNILNTIRSRTQFLSVREDTDNSQALKFMKMEVEDRIEYIKEFIDEFKTEEDSAMLRTNALQFLNALEKLLYEKLQEKSDDTILYVLKEIQEKRDYLRSPGASVKMILEHIALVV